MGPTFLHYMSLSRIESTTKSKKGKSIYTVAAEADRLPNYHDHVQNPKKPIILYGVSFTEAVKLAEEYAEKTLDSIGRKVKKNDFVMIAGVISAPADMSEEMWKIYKRECIKWLIRRWGADNLKSVIEHLDEYFMDDPNILHRHIHFAIVPPIGTRFWKIHPGLTAKREADNAYGSYKKPENMSDIEYAEFKHINRRNGDIAYKKEMSKEQDRFYEYLGEPFGMLRYGPKRLRLTREEIIRHHQEKRIKLKNILKREAQDKKIVEVAGNILHAESDLSNLKKEIKQLETRENNVRIREDTQTEYEKALKSDLKSFVFPEPEKKGFFMESAKDFRERIMPRIMGIVKFALKLVKENKVKKKQLVEKEKEIDKEKLKIEKETKINIKNTEQLYNLKIDHLKQNYDKLINRIFNINTLQELNKIKNEFISNTRHR